MRKILLIVAGLALAACATSPTGRSQLMMVSDSQMAAAGQQMFAQLKSQQPVVRDAAVSTEVQCVVSHLLQALPAEQRQGWEVQVFDEKTPNAFALPGRKIGVHSGMLRLVENEAQLAAVIGHEIGHVLARHANERASMGLLAQIGQEVAGQVISPTGAAVFGLGAQFGVLLPYSRTHEAEADVMGQDLMARAGYDPRESIRLWQLMEKQSQAKPPEFLSTHPATGTRMQGLDAHLQQSLPLYQRAQAQGKVPRCTR
jgi:predicted Zn-dependent protease